MLLRKKLFSFLNRVFNKDPQSFPAIALDCDGTDMSWTVQDGVLTTAPVGGTAQPLSVDLSQYTLQQLGAHVAAQAGYTVPMVAPGESAALSSLVLIDSSGSIAQGQTTILGYTSVLWALMEAYADQLNQAQKSIQALPAQMSVTTAADNWLDLLGSYYKVPRLAGELDSQYGPRIIATVLRPLNNNIAIANAINAAFGQNATVTDTGSEAQPQLLGLFDVHVGYDLLGSNDINGFAAQVAALIETLRAAGTHLNSIAVTGSTLQDAARLGADDGPIIDTLTVGLPYSDDALELTEGDATINWTQSTLYNGVRCYDGSITYNSGATHQETLAD